MIGKITKGDAMEFVNKVENRVAAWYEKAPHLPVGGRQWLGANVWWIVLVGTIIGAFGILNIIFFGALAALFVVGYGGPVGAAIAGVAAIVMVLSLIGAILEIVITAMAIKPLKDKQKKGWSLLLLALIVALKRHQNLSQPKKLRQNQLVKNRSTEFKKAAEGMREDASLRRPFRRLMPGGMSYHISTSSPPSFSICSLVFGGGAR
jgi:uncharacterized membrane protein YhaH (DUF805 family)